MPQEAKYLHFEISAVYASCANLEMSNNAQWSAGGEV